jgi:hypothetical protein
MRSTTVCSGRSRPRRTAAARAPTLIDRIHTLQQNAAAEGPTGERYELSAAERLVLISRLLVWAPAALCVSSFVLFVMSFLPR